MQFINRWAVIVISGIGILLISGCFSVDEPPPKTETPVLITETEMAPSSSTATPVSTGSNLALQLGFSDEHVLLAGSQGFKLQTTRSSVINGQPYIAFYLSRDYQPRVMNDFATVVLIYEGDSEAVGNFVYRIEIREPIDPEQVSNLPAATGWSTSSPFSSKVTIGYEAAGFSLKATRSSVDTQSTAYYSAIVHLNDLYYALTFERASGSTEPKFLETFLFPPEQPPGFTYYDLPYDESWAHLSPKSRIAKALYALGCEFGWNSIYSRDGNFDEEQLFDEQVFKGKRYLLSHCSLNGGAHLVAVFEHDGQDQRILWNTLYRSGDDVSTSPTWGDINGDQAPDLVIARETTGGGGTVDGAFIVGENYDVFQLTSTGDLVDLLFGVNEAKLNVNGEFVQFSDLDGDGIAEIVVKKGNTFLYGGLRLETLLLLSITNIYQLQDDFYYLPARPSDFGFLCQQAVNEFVTQANKASIKEHVYDAYSKLETCKAVGMQEAGWQTIKLDLEKLMEDDENYSLGCRKWIAAVYDSLALSVSEKSSLSTPDSTDWDTLYREADCD